MTPPPTPRNSELVAQDGPRYHYLKKQHHLGWVFWYSLLLLLGTGRQRITPKSKDRQAKCLMSFSKGNTWLPRPPSRPLPLLKPCNFFQPSKPFLPHLPLFWALLFWGKLLIHMVHLWILIIYCSSLFPTDAPISVHLNAHTSGQRNG